MRQRVLTALGLLPIVAGVVSLASPWPVFLLTSLVVIFGIEEIRVLLKHRWLSIVPVFVFLLLCSLLFFLPTLESLVFAWITLGLFVLGVLGSYLSTSKANAHMLRGCLDGLWVAMPMASLIKLHQWDQTGEIWRWQSPVWLVLLPIWIGDSAALAVGRAIGRTPLAPDVSPRKTWEGALANLIGSLVAAWGVGVMVGVPLTVSLACGLACSLLGQGGDLFESYIKRMAGMKDSGNLLPGHGGVMDRIDSLLFAAPVVCLLIVHFVPLGSLKPWP